MDLENRLVVSKGEGGRWTGSLGLIDANYHIGNGKALRSCCIAQGTVSSHLWRNMMRIMWEKNKYIWLDHFAVQQKLTKHCKSTTMEKIKIKNLVNKKLCSSTYHVAHSTPATLASVLFLYWTGTFLPLDLCICCFCCLSALPSGIHTASSFTNIRFLLENVPREAFSNLSGVLFFHAILIPFYWFMFFVYLRVLIFISKEFQAPEDSGEIGSLVASFPDDGLTKVNPWASANDLAGHWIALSLSGDLQTQEPAPWDLEGLVFCPHISKGLSEKEEHRSTATVEAN